MRTLKEANARIDELTAQVLALQAQLGEQRAAKPDEDRRALLARAKALSLAGKRVVVRGNKLYVN